MAGRRELEENLTTRWRYLHIGGSLGFHAPFFAGESESFSRDELQSIVGVLTTTLSWLLDNAARADIPTSLISETLLYRQYEMLDVNNVFLAARWKVDLFGTALPIEASEKSANRLCQNQLIWERYDEQTQVWNVARELGGVLISALGARCVMVLVAPHQAGAHCKKPLAVRLATLRNCCTTAEGSLRREARLRTALG